MAFTVEITEKVEQPLMSRTLVKGTVAYDAAPPSFVELRKHVAASLKADEGIVFIRGLHSVFGTRKSAMEAYVYKSKDAIESFGSKVTARRNLPRIKKVPVQPSS